MLPPPYLVLVLNLINLLFSRKNNHSFKKDKRGEFLIF